MRLAVCLDYATRYTLPFYQDKSIPLDIFYATMSDIKIWCKNYNNKGLKNSNWISNHLKGELFRIGRLQYQLYNCDVKHLDYNLLPFDKNEQMLYIHIPQGEKLIYSDCVKSICDAKAFFSKYFPDFEYKLFFCESWLLFEDNYKFMDESSNILQFQSLFSIVYSNTIDVQGIERIFGKRKLLKQNYAEGTKLQKSAKQYMLDGNKLGFGIGVIEKDIFD